MNRLKTVVVSLLSIMGFSTLAFAEEAAHAASGAGGYVAIAAGIAIGMAVLGGALGQGRAIASALDGIARNPNASDKVFTPMILGLALIESLVLFGFVIAFLLQNKA